jgi:hypothetical protein
MPQCRIDVPAKRANETAASLCVNTGTMTTILACDELLIRHMIRSIDSTISDVNLACQHDAL